MVNPQGDHVQSPVPCFRWRAAAFPGRRECSSCLFLVAWEGHQAEQKGEVAL